jgi:taurine dioxygenase
MNAAARTTLEVRRIAGAIGAEIHGADLSRELPQGVVDEIRSFWLEHLVVFFRDQKLDGAQFMALARRFGRPVEYPMVKGIDGFPEIIEVKKLEHERTAFGAVWHSDTAYLETPPMGTLLLARELPPVGGDTLFASQYAAYDALSDAMKRVLGALRAVNASTKADASKTREDRVREDGRNDLRTDYLATHPVVRTHPETGRKALYVNAGHTVRFEGMSEEESRPLLEYLYRHQTRPEFTCRFGWQPESLALWDNRCAQHNPVNDYHGYRRVMHRITLAGDRPQ